MNGIIASYFYSFRNISFNNIYIALPKAFRGDNYGKKL